jgi:6,7-dimethyl-8-ribityllumazine synthase
MPGPAILVVEARFYEDIADNLVAGATAVLDQAGIPYDRIAVPGVFEVPSVIRYAVRSMEVRAATRRYGGFISLGCVIRGETDHYDHVCREAARALMNLSIQYSLAHGFGILTCDTFEQAVVRADPNGKNYGGRAATACLRMIEIKKSLNLA